MNPIESLLADRAVMAELRTLSHIPPTTLRLRAQPPVEGVRETAERLDRSRALVPAAGLRTDASGAGLEAIVLAFGRPTLLVQDHAFAVPELDEWRQRLEPLRGPLERTLPSIGRIEIRRLPQDMHVGTGWLVAEDVVVTNRHVAEFFARGNGRAALLAKDPFGRDMPVQIDFREEHARSTAAEHTVVEVLWIEELDAQLPDLALLRLRPGSGVALPAPIELATRMPEPRDAVIAVIGYPAWDYRNDAAMMKRLFGDIYGVKRLAPGLISSAGEGFVFEHDCTTLGGNSGSVVVDAASGQAIGLHFAGEFGVRNLAVRAERIAHRLSELEVRVAVPASYPRLGDTRLGAVEPEAVRQPEDYARRSGFKRDFVAGVADAAPDFSALTEDLARLRDSADEHELRYTHFSIWMSAARRLALCTAVNIDGQQLRRYARAEDRWYLDPRLDPEQQIGNELYRRNHLDRGHLVRRLDPVWGAEHEAREAMEDTFHYTNAAPQHERLNQVVWNELEDYLLDNADAHDLRISVFTGPVFRPDGARYRDVELPQEFWKVVVMARRGPGGAMRPHATAYLLSQADLLGNIEFAFGAYRTWQVPIALIEQRTGIGFAPLRRYDPLSMAGREGTMPVAQPIRGWRDIVMQADPATAPAPAPATPVQPLDVIRDLLLAAQRTASLDYVAQFDDAAPADAVTRVGAVVPGMVATEPVFRDDPRFLRIRLPGVDPRMLAGASPFDLVEPLRAALGARAVEPDLPTDFFPEPPLADAVPGQDVLRESTELIGCWVGNAQPAPVDSAWALRNLRVPQAWAFSQAQGRPSRGEGILIAQPDTGVTDHPELAGALDETRWADFLDGGAPIDPLQPNDPFDNPGHGTATGSVVISRGTVADGSTSGSGTVTGSAPAARLVPIRCIESVLRITQSRVARAIEHAVDSNCHVVTMSLGGLWSASLAAAVQRAVDGNLIVLAAAGNCVRVVVWPARFERCIAVAGSNVDDRTWQGSCRGAAVDVTAPAQHVYRAVRRPGTTDPNASGPGEGTSFAVALTAGVAALWLAHHGRDRLIDSLAPGERLQDRFARLLRQTARVPSGWDPSDFGSGIVDALALLQAGLGTPGAPDAEAASEATAVGTPMNTDQAGAAQELLAELAGPFETAAADSAVFEQHGLELIWLALERQRRGSARSESVAGVLPASDAVAATAPPASDALRQALARPEHAGLARWLAVAPDGSEARPAPAEQPSPNTGDDAEVDPLERAPQWVPPALEGPQTWRVANCLLALRRQVDALAPGRSRASDGTIGDAAHASRSSDHNPWLMDGATGIVTALDITHDVAGGCSADAIAEAIRASRDGRVKYLIWNRRIASAQSIGGAPAWTWRPYAGRNPHTKHVHVSVKPERAAYDSESPWQL